MNFLPFGVYIFQFFSQTLFIEFVISFKQFSSLVGVYICDFLLQTLIFNYYGVWRKIHFCQTPSTYFHTPFLPQNNKKGSTQKFFLHRPQLAILSINYFWIFMVRPIRFLATSTLITCTSTMSPTLTASSGCLI